MVVQGREKSKKISSIATTGHPSARGVNQPAPGLPAVAGGAINHGPPATGFIWGLPIFNALQYNKQL